MKQRLILFLLLGVTYLQAQIGNPPTVTQDLINKIDSTVAEQNVILSFNEGLSIHFDTMRCHYTMTFDELILLQGKGKFSEGCTYTGTGYNGLIDAQGVNFTTVAISKDSLSSDGLINGGALDRTLQVIFRYDVNIPAYVYDKDRQNIISGTGTVDKFPFVTAGTNIIGSKFLNSVLIYTGGQVINCFFANASTLTISEGYLNLVVAQNGSVTTVSGASTVIRRVTLNNQANVTVTGGTLQSSVIESGGKYTMNAGTHQYLYVGQGASFVQADVLGTMQYSSISERTTITLGATPITYSNFSGYSKVNTTGSAGYIRYCVLSYINANTMQNITTLQLDGVEASTASDLVFTGANYIRLVSCRLGSNSALTILAGKELFLSNCIFDGKGDVTVEDGRINMTYSGLANGSKIENKVGCGINTVNYANISSNCYIRFQNGSSGNIVSNNALNSSSFILIDNTTVSNINANTMTGGGDITVTNCTGTAVSNNFTSGNGHIVATNCTGTSRIYYASAMGGASVEMLNAVDCWMYSNTASAQGKLIYDGTGSSGAKVSYSAIDAYYYLTVTTSAVNVNVYGLRASGRETLTQDFSANYTGTVIKNF